MRHADQDTQRHCGSSLAHGTCTAIVAPPSPRAPRCPPPRRRPRHPRHHPHRAPRGRQTSRVRCLRRRHTRRSGCSAAPPLVPAAPPRTQTGRRRCAQHGASRSTAVNGPKETASAHISRRTQIGACTCTLAHSNWSLPRSAQQLQDQTPPQASSSRLTASTISSVSSTSTAMPFATISRTLSGPFVLCCVANRRVHARRNTLARTNTRYA